MAIEDDMYLENLQEYVLDENKIVTYKWLSKTLSVHVNQAKQMLYTFACKQKKSKTPVTTTYLISGIKNKGDIAVQKVAIIREDDLETAKSSLDEVTGIHVYSVQKTILKDTNALYTTDYDITKQSLQEANKFSSIKCAKAKPRSLTEVEKLTNAAAATPSTSAQPAALKGKTVQKKTDEDATGSQAVPAKTAPKKGKAGIADMFSRAKTSKPAVKEETKTEEASSNTASSDKQKEVSSKPKAKGMASFFGKPTKKTEAAVKDKPVEKDKPKEEKKIKVEEKVSPIASKKRQSPITVIPDSDEEFEERPKKKRRRRVQQMSDSSSDEEMSVDSPAVPPSPSPPPSPVREPSPSPEPEEQTSQDPSTSSGHHRRRKRVMKSKTFMDEEGCMVTEKVWESESTDASEPEEEASKKPTQSKKPEIKEAKKQSPPPKKKKSPVKTKQQSLMSFFKKK
ncbi:DNA polymerase delta subunit 3-like [Ptychodera flava]|uniref:DNA polymerase delta subunit 3-like n=1 Tax=Ptychodera flava TaxID=63121 RepID=UPI00396A4A42